MATLLIDADSDDTWMEIGRVCRNFTDALLGKNLHTFKMLKYCHTSFFANTIDLNPVKC